MADEHTFYIKQGDTRPYLEEQLLDGAGRPIDLSVATVTLKLETAAGVDQTLAGTVTVLNGPKGWVRYAWAAADTASLDGTYYREWTITLLGEQWSVPNDRQGYEVVVTVDA